jgi:hypothetical protein
MVGYERESIDGDHREASTGENRVTASFRARPARWANLRAGYLFGDRGGAYDPFVTRESYWYGPDEATDRDNPRFTFSNHPDMRRFDASDRRRHQTDVTVTVTPGDVFSLAGSVRYRNNDFDSEVTPVRPLAATGVGEVDAVTPGTQLGLLDDDRLRFAIDAFYMPADRLSVNAFVSWDTGTSFQRSLEFQEDAKENPSTREGLELGPWTRASSQWTAHFDDWQQGSSFPWVEAVGSEFLLRDTSRSHQWGNRRFNLGTFLAPGYDAHIGWAAFTYRF